MGHCMGHAWGLEREAVGPHRVGLAGDRTEGVQKPVVDVDAAEDAQWACMSSHKAVAALQEWENIEPRALEGKYDLNANDTCG